MAGSFFSDKFPLVSEVIRLFYFKSKLVSTRNAKSLSWVFVFFFLFVPLCNSS